MINEDYNKVANRYVKKLEMQYNMYFDFWVADEVGGVALFGDFFIGYDDIRYLVDNYIPFNLFLAWYAEMSEQFAKYRDVHSGSIAVWLRQKAAGVKIEMLEFVN